MTREKAIKQLKLMQSGARHAIRFKKNDKEISEEERKEDMEIYQDQLAALNIAIKALEQEPRWIPVSERLPEEGGFYLVSTTDCITIMEFVEGWISENIGRCDGYVLAWMPLQKPYKEESENKRMKWVTFYRDLMKNEVLDLKVHNDKKSALRYFNETGSKYFKQFIPFTIDMLPNWCGSKIHRYYIASAKEYEEAFDCILDEVEE